MSPVGDAFDLVLIGFPRVSGDEPPLAGLTADEMAFSPREWG